MMSVWAFYNLRHFQFIYSKKRLGLQRSVTFNQATEKDLGLGLRGWGPGLDLEICTYLWKNPGYAPAQELHLLSPLILYPIQTIKSMKTTGEVEWFIFAFIVVTICNVHGTVTLSFSREF